MMNAKVKKSEGGDPVIQAVHDALSPFRKAHPKAKVDVYRRNDAIVRIRVVDPDFKKLDRVQRDELVSPYLDRLPEDVLNQITLLLLLAPEETKKSLANFDFENPVPLEA